MEQARFSPLTASAQYSTGSPSCAQGDQLGLIGYAAPEETAILLIPCSSTYSSLKYTAHCLVICEPPFR